MVLILEVDPLPKPRMVHSDKWKQRPVVVKYWDYAATLRWQAKLLNYVPDEILRISFIIPMPKSWSKKKKQAMLGQPHQQRPDLDNLLKGFKDILLKDDSHIWRYQDVRKRWGTTGRIIIYQKGDPV